MITRRELAAVLSASAVVLAQTPPAALPQNPDEELKAAKDLLQQNLQQVRKYEVPISTEPACYFKV